MVTHFSTALGSTPEAFKAKGVFDGFVGVDTKLYIDPHLLSGSQAPEIQAAANRFHRYFSDLISILRNVKSPGDRFWREAAGRLVFKEIRQLSLGYGKSTTKGSAIGVELGAAILSTAIQLVQAGIVDPELFELVGLLEDGIGADRISDMVASIILEDFAQYSQRLVSELGLTNGQRKIRGKTYTLPEVRRRKLQTVILIPLDILRALPVAQDWSDVDLVCSHNSALRDKVNRMIGDTWKKAVSARVAKHTLKRALLDNPDAFRDLLKHYKSKPKEPYDMIADPRGEVVWHETGTRFAKAYPIDLGHFGPVNATNLRDVVGRICQQFKKLVEDNGLHALLYDDRGKLKHERAAQLLFFGLADAYCTANNLDLSREPNAGHGPVDFKISRGLQAKATVEVKYSSNPNLEHGYEQQLPTYTKSE
ncbi:MAG: hypothetical protein K8R65_06780, partial [Nitrospirae bacterium]|nr:hypothetical protein [Nitrospirota bacterium]